MLELTPRDPEVETLGRHLTVSSEMLSALAHPARQDIVQVLARGELNAGQIAARFKLSRPTVSHHLAILRRAGLVHARQDGKEVFYRLDKDAIVTTLQGLVDCLLCC
jgi:DNA-binding transcriptional ArsR family regulator